MKTSLDIPIKGEIRGVAEVRDKDGNLKGSFTFGGEASIEDAAAVSGKSEEHIKANFGKNLIGD